MSDKTPKVQPCTDVRKCAEVYLDVLKNPGSSMDAVLYPDALRKKAIELLSFEGDIRYDFTERRHVPTNRYKY